MSFVRQGFAVGVVAALLALAGCGDDGETTGATSAEQQASQLDESNREQLRDAAEKAL